MQLNLSIEDRQTFFKLFPPLLRYASLALDINADTLELPSGR